jgi:dUTPase
LGAAKRREVKIEQLKQATAERINAAEQARLYASAVHESAHILFGLHFDIPLGGEGVKLTRYVFGHESGFELAEFPGFTDTRFSEWVNVTRIENLSDYQRSVQVASYLSGPFAEYMWHQFVAEQNNERVPKEQVAEIVRAGLNDFQGVLGRDGIGLERFGQLCFIIFLDAESLLEGVSDDVMASTRQWVALSRTFLNTYFTDIVRFADVLCKAPGLKLSRQQVHEWAEESFTRHELPELRVESCNAYRYAGADQRGKSSCVVTRPASAQNSGSISPSFEPPTTFS